MSSFRWRALGVVFVLAVLGIVVGSVGSGCNGDDSSACPAGSTTCGGRCAMLQTDPVNCGACGTACGANQICDLGMCTAGIGDASPHDTGSDVAADSPGDGATVDSMSDGSTADAPGDSAAEAASDAPADAPSEGSGDAAGE